MADCKRKTGNLFDKDSMIVNFYLTTTGTYTPTSANSRSILFKCEPNTTYTFSALPFKTFRIATYANIPTSGTTEYTNFYNRDSTDTETAKTFTTYSGENYAVIFCYNNSYEATLYTIDQFFSSVMLNSGTTPLPYEPYGWLHSLRKLGNATDIITTLPTDIYTDGQTIGVNILNPSSTVEVNGTTKTGQTFSAGTYYIYNGKSMVAGFVNYIDDGESPSVIHLITNDAVVTSTGNLTVYVDSGSTEKVMVAKSSTPVPFQPYSNCTIKGNMQQTGTPTSTTPIQPSECGDRTGNLFDVDAWYTQITPTRCTVSKTGNAITISATGNDSYTGNGGLHVPVESVTAYTFRFTSDNDNSGSIYLFENGMVDSAHTHAFNNNNKKQVTFTTLSDTTFLTVRLGVYNSGNSITYSNIMLNTGSEALPYEPYGYKLTISSANTTTPVYLGEVQSTRQIGKYVFTGQESDISINLTYSRFEVFLPNAKSNGVRLTPAFCSHYQVIDDGRAIGDVPDESLYSDVENSTRWFIKTTDYTTIPDFKAYLAAQYAAGTPVCVWYVLSSATTGIVNEPIRKIGDYADSVSGITIPTITGKDSFDVQTTLKPSEVELTYTGWHDASVGEWDGSDWQ